MAVKGNLLLIGGNEYRGNFQHDEPETNSGEAPAADYAEEEDSQLKSLFSDPETARIEIITTGTSYPRESFERYERYFKSLGVSEIGMLDIDTKYLKDEQIKRAETATAIFIGGGNQRKILEYLKGSQIHDIIVDRYKTDKNFTIGGTSAGAMTLGELTIGDGYEKEMLIKGDVDIREGLKLLPKIIVDTHFINSNRMSRLTLAVTENPGFIGIGLADNSGVLIREGTIMEHAGGNVVTILDASEADTDLYATRENGDHVSVSNIKLSFLSSGDTWSLGKKQFLKSSKA